MGLPRTAVGVALVAAPSTALGFSRRETRTGASVLLLRTIGIRDVVIGLGTVLAARSGSERDARHWLHMGLTSDGMDAITGLLSRRSIGAVEAIGSGGVALAFVGLDLWAIRALSAVAPSPRMAAGLTALHSRAESYDRVTPILPTP